jgi:YD repeat-containing protein
MSDSSGSTSWAYDPLGRVISQTKLITGISLLPTGYSYDRLDRLKTLTYPDGEVITYTYNAQGLVAGLSSSLSGTTYLSQLPAAQPADERPRPQPAARAELSV